jgi:hypothetical protein
MIRSGCAGRAALLGRYDATTYCLFTRKSLDGGVRASLGEGWVVGDAAGLYE